MKLDENETKNILANGIPDESGENFLIRPIQINPLKGYLQPTEFSKSHKQFFYSLI